MEAERPALPDTGKVYQSNRGQTLRSANRHLFLGDQADMSYKTNGGSNVMSASESAQKFMHADGRASADALDPSYKVALASKMKALVQSRKERQSSSRSVSQPAPEKAALPCQPAAEVSQVGSEAEADKGVSGTAFSAAGKHQPQRKEDSQQRNLRERQAGVQNCQRVPQAKGMLADVTEEAASGVPAMQGSAAGIPEPQPKEDSQERKLRERQPALQNCQPVPKAKGMPRQPGAHLPNKAASNAPATQGSTGVCVPGV